MDWVFEANLRTGSFHDSFRVFPSLRRPTFSALYMTENYCRRKVLKKYHACGFYFPKEKKNRHLLLMIYLLVSLSSRQYFTPLRALDLFQTI